MRPSGASSSTLSTDLHFVKPVMGLHLPLKTKILEYAGRRVYAKDDLPPIPRSSKPQYIRASNPDSETTTLQKDSKECLQWLLDTFQHMPHTPLADPPCLICFGRQGGWGPGGHWGLGGDLHGGDLVCRILAYGHSARLVSSLRS